MKNALIAAASLAAIAAVVPAAAQAQDAATDNIGAYVNLGLAHVDGQGSNFEAIQGRFGYRFHNNFGVEGELAAGVKGYGTGTTLANGDEVRLKLKHQAAAYGVGFLPIGPNTDLLARIGYGTTKINANLAGLSDEAQSVNFGVGAQHHFDGLNGVRVDFTRHDFEKDLGHANVWSVGYSRKF